jgi:hypothetical protein
MTNYARYVTSYLDEQGIKYQVKNDRKVLITYKGDNLETIPINVFFDEDDDPVVQLVCWEILNFKAREEQAIQLCNKLNLQYRWVKFYIDNDKDMVASLDATFDEETCGEICLSLVRRMVSIIDDVYPEVAKARWA